MVITISEGIYTMKAKTLLCQMLFKFYVNLFNEKRRQPDLHRRIAVLQTAALLLGYTAIR